MSAPALKSSRRWLWGVLAVLAVIATVSVVLIARQRATSPYGLWRIALTHPGGEVPFGLEVAEEGGKPVAYLLNPPERLQAESTVLDGKTLTISFPSYGSRFVATLGSDGKLTGSAALVRRTGPVQLALTGTKATWRFFESPAKPTGDLSGKWQVTLEGDKPETGLAQFTQTGNKVSGSIQFPTGDTRFLAGEISGDKLSLSMFDGNSTSLWRAKVAGTALSGERFGATSTSATLWTGTKAAEAGVTAVAVEKPPVDRIAFSFPKSDGKQVSLADPQFKGKVVVVAIGGTWCPNCQDEARFLGPYAAAHKKDGLEVVGLNFEYAGDRAATFAKMDSFAKRYTLGFPMLLAGEPTPESTKVALAAIGGVKVYPSALFIGRDERLREIHVGWAGPATGALNVKAQEEFDATVKRLLAEPA
jgi:thiol-disulfide isomerase/thioredoxin